MKSKIDKYISEHYYRLLDIVTKKVNYYSVDICPIEMLSEAYMYVLECDIEKESDIPRYIVNYVTLELRYPKSSTNFRINKDSCLHFFETFYFDEATNDMIEMIDFKSFMKGFLTTLDRVDQIVLEVMLNKGKTKKRELSEHFNIPESTINTYRLRIKHKLRKYYEQYQS